MRESLYNVLIVDDSSSNLQLLSSLLSSEGYFVRAAISGELALIAVDQDKPDLILLDVTMPGMNGIQVCKRLREIPRNHDIPIIFISGLNELDDKLNALSAGGSDYITKPFQNAEVLARVSIQFKLKQQENELKARLNTLNEYKKAMDASSLVSRTNSIGRFTYINSTFEDLIGYQESELLGHSHFFINEAITPSVVQLGLQEALHGTEVWNGHLTCRTKKGSRIDFETSICPILDENMSVQEYIITHVDVTRLVYQEVLIQEYSTDSLTGLPNRIQLIRDMKSVTGGSLLMVDINRFKEVNDFYGLQHGDNVLIATAESIDKLSNKEEQAYRIGGDLFGILFLRDSSSESVFEKTSKIVSAFDSAPILSNGVEVNIQITVGVSLGQSASYTNSALALAHAKLEHESYMVYDTAMHAASHYDENILLAQGLKRAINSGRIVSFFQPIIDNKTERVVKYESLVRMIEEDGRIILPFAFLKVAKTSRQYGFITKAVISQSLRLVDLYQCQVSINITVEDIQSIDTVSYITREVKICKYPSNIVFEITESEGIENYTEVASFVSEMKKLGCEFSIDDFGTGYSNFRHLLNIHADYLKIDGSIIKDIVADPEARILTKVIVDMAHELGLKTIAEFVENREIFNLVVELGVDYSQGYYFGKPEPWGSK